MLELGAPLDADDPDRVFRSCDRDRVDACALGQRARPLVPPCRVEWPRDSVARLIRLGLPFLIRAGCRSSPSTTQGLRRQGILGRRKLNESTCLQPQRLRRVIVDRTSQQARPLPQGSSSTLVVASRKATRLAHSRDPYIIVGSGKGFESLAQRRVSSPSRHRHADTHYVSSSAPDRRRVRLRVRGYICCEHRRGGVTPMYVLSKKDESPRI